MKGTAEGGVVGVLIDCRGRPLQLPRSEEARVAKLREWMAAVAEGVRGQGSGVSVSPSLTPDP